jgi:hypothetical protein
MSMQEFLYHGGAAAVEGQITSPGPYTIDGHARCGLPNPRAGRYQGQHGGQTIPGILSYGPCSTEVIAIEEDVDGFFRTEVRATVENLKVLGDFPLSADRITMGLVSVYRRHWYDRGTPHARRVRVLPMDCSLGSLTVNGRPAGEWLPAPFRYSKDRCEAHLRGDDPDASIDDDIQKAIAGSGSRFVQIANFGRIYFGEWGIGTGASQHIHKLTMLRLALGSPVTGTVTVSTGQGDGSPTPP